MAPLALWEQSAFRGRNDDGSETTATWKANANTDWTQLVDTNFRVRFGIIANGVISATSTFRLQYNLASAGWVSASDSSSVVRASASANFADGADCTQQLVAGTFFADNNGMEDVNCLTTSATGWGSGENESEVEYCVQIRSGDVTDGQTLQLRLLRDDTTVMDTYTATPTITVSEPAAATVKKLGLMGVG